MDADALRLEEIPPEVTGSMRGIDALRLFHGRDLRRLPHEERALIDALTTELDGFSPPTSASVPQRRLYARDGRWYVWRFPVRGGDGLVTFGGRVPTHIPGGSAGCFSVYDSAGAQTSCTGWFGVGYRMIVTDARVLGPREHGFSCIEVHCIPYIDSMITGPARQHFALFEDGLDIVHMADERGTTARSRSWHSPVSHSAIVERRSADNWERALSSSNPAEVLRTLHWLGGRRDRDDEQVRALAEEVLARPGARRRLSELERSGDDWLRQSARLVTSNPDD